jgi:hypothetical protein
MSTTEFLEQAAMDVHYSSDVKTLLSAQSPAMQRAVNNHSTCQIHNQYSNVGYLANPTNVIELPQA